MDEKKTEEMSDGELLEKYDKMMERLKNPKTRLSGNDLEVLKGKVRKSIAVDLNRLLGKQAFVSSMALRFDIIPVRDFRVSTAQTDGTKIFFDIDFYSKLTQKERMFVIAHEVWHNIFLHFLRRRGRDPKLWNVATDCEINVMLRNEGFDPPKNLCFPPENLEEKCAEDIYEEMVKDLRKMAKSGASEEEKNGAFWEKYGGGMGNSSNKKKSRNGKLEGQFDRHADKEDQDSKGDKIENPEGDGGSLPEDKWGEKGIDDDYRPSISDSTADRIRRMVISETQRMERLKGSIPGYLQRIVNGIFKPEISWREHLSQFVTSCFGDRRQWLPPQRRSVWSGLYFQSRRGEKINVSVVVDTSGSCTGDIPKFLSELVGLLNTFGRYELTLVQCDAKVQDVTVYDDSNPFPLENVEEIEWKGFGGSDLNPAFKELSKLPESPACNIVFTDGYIDCPKKNPLGCDTLFILTKDGSEPCSWGKHVRFKEDTRY